MSPASHTLARVLSLATALASFYMAFRFWQVLEAPLDGSNRAWAAEAWLLVPTEFLAAHAGAMASGIALSGSIAARLAKAAFLLVGYLVLLGSLVGIAGASSPVVAAVAVLIAGRLASSALRDRGNMFVQVGFGFMTVFTFLGIFVIVTSKDFMGGGFAPQIVAQLQAAYPRTGFWANAPHVPIAFCAMWFLVAGLIELLRIAAGPAPLDATADFTIQDSSGRTELRFTPGEMEVRRRQTFADLVLPFSVGVLLSVMPIAAFTGGLPFLGYLISGILLTWLGMIVLSIGQTTVVRARAGALEWLKSTPVLGKTRMIVDGETAAQLQVSVKYKHGLESPHPSDIAGYSLDLMSKAGGASFFEGLADRRRADAICRLLLAYVSHGSGSGVWQALCADNDVQSLLGARAQALLETPTRTALPPLIRGNMPAATPFRPLSESAQSSADQAIRLPNPGPFRE